MQRRVRIRRAALLLLVLRCCVHVAVAFQPPSRLQWRAARAGHPPSPWRPPIGTIPTSSGGSGLPAPWKPWTRDCALLVGPKAATRALRGEEIEWTPCGSPDFYAFADRLTAPSARWEGEVRAWRPAAEGEIQSLGTVRVGVEEVMRACGGAVAGVKEAVASDAGGSEEMYGLYEHNRGDDGFLFAEDGAFSHGPEVIPPREAADGAWEVVTILVHASHPKTRLRVRLELRGAAPIALTGVSWSWDGLGEAVAGSAGCEEGGILVGRALRAKRGAGPTPQFLRARASWQEAECAEYDVGAVLDDPNNTASHLARDHGLLLRIGAPMEDGSGAIRLDVGGLFPAMDGSSRRRSGAVWSQVYDAAGGNLREAALFESSSSEV